MQINVVLHTKNKGIQMDKCFLLTTCPKCSTINIPILQTNNLSCANCNICGHQWINPNKYDFKNQSFLTDFYKTSPVQVRKTKSTNDYSLKFRQKTLLEMMKLSNNR